MSKSVASVSSRKRPAPDTGAEPSTSKVQKVHPFFVKDQGQKDTPFQWLKPLGPKGTCLHGTNLQPQYLANVAAFDLDGTLIKSEFSKKGTPSQWEWWRSIVPAKLQELHQAGYSIVIISNQGVKPAALDIWKRKIPLIGAALPTVPFRIFAAVSRDGYRKPMPGIWVELDNIYRENGVEINRTNSFFVGDAAGRQYPGGKGDFASTDRKWALNVGIAFHTPEEFFLGLSPNTSTTLPGFHPSSLANAPRVTPTSTPIIPSPRRQEIVLFVGYPCLGKSTFYRHNFFPEGYQHINQDLLKTRDKCVKAVHDALVKGRSCVIDNTNRNAMTRKLYIDAAKKYDVPVRCFLFSGSIELAWHNNLYRAFNLPASVRNCEANRQLVPYGAFTGFRDNFEEPKLSEGFIEIKKVNWVFEGTEEERKHWSMWLQIDGK
ncbi:polynucleotide kinase 3 phosphatase-domain-containing protein [Cyathus striatus]|nr:polynucleotide kinase 3 phosphatase-domain-containing protein [Cyathus striatus]